MIATCMCIKVNVTKMPEIFFIYTDVWGKSFKMHAFVAHLVTLLQDQYIQLLASSVLVQYPQR